MCGHVAARLGGQAEITLPARTAMSATRLSVGFPGSVGSKRYFGAVTAHPAEPVPDADPDEAAIAAAALREYREWAAAGRPGAVSHEEAMAELLGDAQ